MAQLSRHKTVREALQYVRDNPVAEDIPPLDMEIWELVARKLFSIANAATPNIVGSMSRGVRAQRMIMNRTTGTRRQATPPASLSDKMVTFKPLGTGTEEEKPNEHGD